ncbi:MAG TPA: dTMP kinase [Rectinemataceae bacterium]|nr:dTMP kinase [Rectinemataceae bacterium]
MQSYDTDTSVKNFIVFEGIDGSGTTTQLRRLSSMMERNNIPHAITAEPTSRPEGVLIRRVLRGDIKAEPGTVAYLFAADRYQHVFGEEGILEAVRGGKIVACDRYCLSSLAYQGIACGMELPKRLNAIFPAPGLTLFFKIDPEIAMRRVHSRDQLEIYEKLHIQKQVSAAYDKVLADARASGWKIAVIDAEKSMDEVAAQIIAALESHLEMSLER